MALRQVHGRYAAYWNAAHTSSGHAWQGRFYFRVRWMKGAFVAGAALRRTESGARENGARGGGVALVKRWGALRNGRSRPLSRHQALEPAMVSGGLAEFSGRGGNGAGVGCPSPEHPHRAATWDRQSSSARSNRAPSVGCFHGKASGCRPQKAGHQREAGSVYVPQTYPAIHASA